jgi:hypothetical protein
MNKEINRADMVLVLGVLGIIGVFITIISDLILLGRPISAISFFGPGMGTENMAFVAQWRITLGAFLGIIVLPLQISGLITVYHGLKAAGKKLPMVAVITDIHALIMGVAFHISYAFIGSGWKLYNEAGQGNQAAAGLVKQFSFYWKFLIIIMGAEILLSSTIYVFLILKKRTLYPRWMAVLNPVCVLLVMFPLICIFPAPIGGFIAPTYMNVSTMIFFVFSTLVIYRRLKLIKPAVQQN